jgi:hypothetical protein
VNALVTGLPILVLLAPIVLLPTATGVMQLHLVLVFLIALITATPVVPLAPRVVVALLHG